MFILGVVGIFVELVAFIAWYLGASAKREIKDGAPYAFEGKLKTGYYLGLIFGVLRIVVYSVALLVGVLFLLADLVDRGF
ncbi:MAG: hypothetical protein QM713_08660 [Arachnia sp.]